MKGEVDKLDVDILVPAPADFSKLSDAVKYVVKETEYNDLFKKINAIKTTDTSNLVKKKKKKIDYDTRVNEIEKQLLLKIIVMSILLHKNLIS